jgi:hypothetical protein
LAVEVGAGFFLLAAVDHSQLLFEQLAPAFSLRIRGIKHFDPENLYLDFT